MPNLSQIDEMKWPTKARKLQTIALKRLFVFVEAQHWKIRKLDSHQSITTPNNGIIQTSSCTEDFVMIFDVIWVTAESHFKNIFKSQQCPLSRFLVFVNEIKRYWYLKFLLKNVTLSVSSYYLETSRGKRVPIEKVSLSRSPTSAFITAKFPWK